jgi:VIT1/CCC1 family predicted Fe2+/Mn2+ transporter
MTLAFAIFIILFFNYYIAVAKKLNFKKRFWEMFIISMGVAAFTFGIGYLIRMFLGVDV